MAESFRLRAPSSIPIRIGEALPLFGRERKDRGRYGLLHIRLERRGFGTDLGQARVDRWPVGNRLCEQAIDVLAHRPQSVEARLQLRAERLQVRCDLAGGIA